MYKKDVIFIQGGNSINGIVNIHGSKNSTSAIIPSSILLDDCVTFNNIPDILDIKYIFSILIRLGADISILSNNNNISYKGNHRVQIKPNIKDYHLHEDVSKLRASSSFIGPILSKYGKIKTYSPGGCKIGLRPINFHLDAFKKMGASIEIENGCISAEVKNQNKRLSGAVIEFPTESVGATQNVINAAVLAKGSTLIKNPSLDPDVLNMIDFLKKIGAKINIKDKKQVEVQGVESLSKVIEYTMPTDRLVTGTYVVIAAATKGNIILENVKKEQFEAEGHSSYLNKIGINISYDELSNVCINGDKSILKPFELQTETFPGFSTDLQSIIMTLATIIKGESQIVENIFENRLTHVPELIKMGADIKIINNKISIIKGVNKLNAAKIVCTDLRASVAMIIAGLVADGLTEVHMPQHLDRGYANLIEQLNMCGAQIERKFIFSQNELL